MPDLNQDFIDDAEQCVKGIFVALIPIGLIIDLIAWRWRKVANVVIYLEALNTLVQTFVPFDYGDFDLLVIV